MAASQEVRDLAEKQFIAFEDYRKSSTTKIDLIDRDLTTLSKQLSDAMLTIKRPSMGERGDSWQSPGERKALDLGIRALFRGDQATANNHFAEVKAASAGSDPDGGYLVLPQFSSDLLRIMAEISPVAKLARTVNLDSGLTFEEVIDRDTAAASWTSEAGARTATTAPTLKKNLVTVGEIFAMPQASQTLIDGASIDIVGWLQGKIGEAFAATESAAFHTGDGVGKPRGFLTHTTAATGDATRTWGDIEHVATGASGAFATASTSVNSADVLISCMSKMKAQYLPGASWLMSRATAATCRQLKDAQGRHVWVDSLQVGQPNVLLGFPVYLSEDMPVIASNSLSIAFANWQKCYTIVRRLGVRFLVDPYSDKPNVGVYAYQRVGGQVFNSEALKLVKFA